MQKNTLCLPVLHYSDFLFPDNPATAQKSPPTNFKKNKEEPPADTNLRENIPA